MVTLLFIWRLTLLKVALPFSPTRNKLAVSNILTEPSVGELRWIARLNPDLLPNEEPFGDASTTNGGEAIEGSDVVSLNSTEKGL